MISSTSLVLITFFLGSSWMATGFVVTPKTPFPSIATTMTPTRLSSSITTSQDFGPSNSNSNNQNEEAATGSLTVPESTTNQDLMALSSSQVKESSSVMSDSSMNLFQEAMAGILWGDASTMTFLVVAAAAATMSLTVVLSILTTATDLAASSSSPLLE